MLCTHGDEAPPDSDVEAWMARVGRADARKLIVHATGAHPTAKQRTMLGEYWKRLEHGQPPCALLSDSLIARSVMTAIVWFSNAPMRAFAADDVDGALKWLEELTQAADVVRVRDAIATMRRTLDDKTRAP